MKSFSYFGDGIISSVQKNVKSSIETSGSTFSEIITSVMSGDNDDPVPPKTSTTFSGMISSVLSQDKSEAGIAKIGSGDNIVSAMSQDKIESGIAILENADDIASVMSQDNGEEVGIATIGSTLGLSTSSVQNADNYQTRLHNAQSIN